MNIVVTILSVWVCGLLYEIGHVVGAIFGGMSIRLFAFWPFLIIRKPDGSFKIRLRLRLSAQVAGVYPLVAKTTNLRRRRVFFTAGGPLMSLLVAIVAVKLGNLCLPAPETTAIANPVDTNPVALFLDYLGLLSGFWCVTSLLPVGIKYYPTDGAQLIALWKNATWVRATNAILLMQTALWTGKRPRDFDPDWVDDALDLADGSQQSFVAHHFAYLYAMDSGESKQAGDYLDRIMKSAEKSWAPNWSVCVLEYAYYLGRYRGNATSARHWFERGKSSREANKAGRYLSEAAVLLAENDLPMAQKRMEAGLAALDEVLSAGLAQIQREQLEDIGTQIQFRGALAA